jgi:regulator of protease activity HflC (stomatin/prohibitin superfamily)
MIKLIAAATVAGVAALYGLAGITFIEPGEQGILVKQFGADKGMQPGGLTTGTTWVDPFSYDVIVYDTKANQYEMDTMNSQTKDGQPILVDVSFDISLNSEVVYKLHEKVGPDWYNRIVLPAARSAIRTSTASVLSDQIYTNEGRTAVSKMITAIIQTKTSDFINIDTNLRDLSFENKAFIQKLEEKAVSAQQEEINRRNAKAAEQEAIRVANVAQGLKAKTILESEAAREQARLRGEGSRLEKEEEAKGLLAMATAEAEGQRLRREALAGPGGQEMVSIEWAKNMGPNVKVYGIPTGAPGTSSLMDLNGILKGAFKGAE